MSKANRELTIVTRVARSYSHCGRNVKHRTSTKKYWFAYGFDSIGKFLRIKIHPLQVWYYKARIKSFVTVRCDSCGLKYKTVKSKTYVCPNCGTMRLV